MKATSETTGEQHGIADACTECRWRRLMRLLPALLIYGVVVATGLRGIDYGFHADEKGKNIKYLTRMVATETLLPEDYIYPSVIYWVGLAALTPDVAWLFVDHPPEGRVSHLTSIVDSDAFQLRMRSLFLMIACLAVIWVYLIVLLWRKSVWEASVASAALGWSWEFAYHARFIAPDCLVVQFGALTLLCCMLAHLRGSQAWLYAAAVAAGLTTGTKYPAGLLLLPVMVAAHWACPAGADLKARAMAIGKLLAAFAIAFLMSTPGMLLRPTYFLHSVHYVMTCYSEGWYNYTVAGFGDHVGKLGTYLTGVLFSPFPPIAYAVFGFAMLGLLALARESWRTAMVFLIFPVIYFLYFGTQRAMLIRNMLVLMPFLSVLAARGAVVTAGWLSGIMASIAPGRVVQGGFALLLAVGLAINAGWLVYAAETIADRVARGPQHQRTPYETLMQQHDEVFLDQLHTHMGAKSNLKFALSPRIRAALISKKLLAPDAPQVSPDQADYVVFFRREGVHRRSWPTHLPRLYAKQFGPYEVNLNYYSSWQGDDRILLMEPELARQVGQLGAIWGKEYGRVLPPFLKNGVRRTKATSSSVQSKG